MPLPDLAILKLNRIDVKPEKTRSEAHLDQDLHVQYPRKHFSVYSGLSV